MTISGALNDVVSALQSVGIKATVDPRNLNPPAAWVSARTMPRRNVLCGSKNITVDIYFIVPDNGTMNAVRALETMLDGALSVLDAAEDVDLAEAVQLPSGGGALPAFRLTIETEI